MQLLRANRVAIDENAQLRACVKTKGRGRGRTSRGGVLTCACGCERGNRNLSLVVSKTMEMDSSVTELMSRLERLQVLAQRRRRRPGDEDGAEDAGMEEDGSDEAGEPAAPAVAADLAFQGCFADTNSARDLPKLVSMFSVTPRRCAHACATLGFAYAGMQDGAECWCGATFGTLGTSTACSRACTGDGALRCGGPFANDVYASGSVFVSACRQGALCVRAANLPAVLRTVRIRSAGAGCRVADPDDGEPPGQRLVRGVLAKLWRQAVRTRAPGWARVCLNQPC